MATCSVVHLKDIDIKDRIDAEYFQPEFLQTISKLSKNSYSLETIAKPTTSAFYPAATHLYSIGEVPFIRCVDVISYPVISSLQNNEFEKLPKSFIKEHKTIKKINSGDIVITKVGTPCYASVIDESLKEISLSRTVLGLTDIKIDPYYLVAFLRSKYGFLQLKRECELTIQLQLTLHRVGRIKVFIPSDEQQIKEISSIMKNCFKLFKKSHSLYEKAQNLLLEELNLVNFNPSYDLSYITTLSEVVGAHRIDAEYFQPAYNKMMKKIVKCPNGFAKLLTLVDNVNPSFNPEKHHSKNFSYIELANVDASIGVINNASEIRGEEAPSRAKRILRKDDVIVSSVEGSLEKVALVDDEYDGSLASTGFFQFRFTKILPEVLLVMSKSIVLQTQFKRECSGTILTAIPNKSLTRILIPIISDDIQHKLVSLIQKAHKTRKKARHLLGEAKRKIEEVIEEES